MHPEISILITSYNYGPYIERAVHSALRQTLRRSEYEVIVVDDGSTDDTLERLKPFSRDVRLHHQPNGGLPAACNRGIALCDGALIIRLDADDELEPTALEEFRAVFSSDPQIGLAHGDRWEVDGSGRTTLKRVNADNIYDIIAPGIMFRKQCIVDAGLYRNVFWEEHDLMIRLRRRCDAHHVARPLYRYYLHGQNMTASVERRRQGWQQLIELWGIGELKRWGSDPDLEHVEQHTATGGL